MYKVYENDYLVYDDGRVFSTKKNKFQNLRKHTNGYLRATIHGKDMYVHRLVAMCFLDNPNEYKEVNHIDGNKTNNHLSNLEWCNRSQNNKHAFDIGLRDKEFMKALTHTEKAELSRRKRRKYSVENVHKIKLLITQGLTDGEIVKSIGGSRGAVYQIRMGKSYKEIV